MGTIHRDENWLIRVQGNEHPPVHVHVICSDGKAIVYLNSNFINNGVPAATLLRAQEWVANHHALIHAEWVRMNNPAKR
jgi:hypothetical protein